MRHILTFMVSEAFFIKGMSLISHEKINLKDISFYAFYLFFLCIFILNYEYSPNALRIILNYIIYVLLSLILFKKSFKDSVLLGLFILLIAMVAEFLYVTIIFPFWNHSIVLTETAFIALINNIFIGLIMYFVCSRKVSQKLYVYLVEITNKIPKRYVAFFSLLIIVIFNFVCWSGYLASENLIEKYFLLFFGTLVGIFSAIIIFFHFRTNNKYRVIFEKYNISLQSIRDFEETLEKYRINTHENRNQLRTIRNMTEDKKVEAYIDNLLGEDFSEEETLLNMAQKIPSGGLRGIIYTKLLLMYKQSIPVELTVDKKITYSLIEKIDDITLTDVCRILGVFLDNAIEATEAVDDKYILIELYEENHNTVISITNNYDGYIDLESMGTAGTTTKGQDRGHGLALVNQLLKKNQKLEHSSSLTEDGFMQTIKIKA